MKDPNEPLASITERLGIGHYHRHVFLCTGPNCCTPEVGADAWDTLKKELKERNLSLSSAANACYRTRANCLRVCAHGPIAVVYPDGTWYHGLTAERIPLFVTQHLERGEPVKEWVFAENPLPQPPGLACPEPGMG